MKLGQSFHSNKSPPYFKAFMFQKHSKFYLIKLENLVYKVQPQNRSPEFTLDSNKTIWRNEVLNSLTGFYEIDFIYFMKDGVVSWMRIREAYGFIQYNSWVTQ